MQENFRKIGARIYLCEDDGLIEKVTYIYEDGTESEPLSRFLHLGMFTDSILFGEECQIRFFIYPYSLRIYDTDVNSFEFINGTDRTISVSCFGKHINVAPREREQLTNSEKKKFRHSNKK